MSVRVRKINYQVVMDRLDDDGNVVDELSTQEPLVLWPHQLADLPTQVAAVVKQAEAQAAETPKTEASPNRAQRRAATKRTGKKTPPKRAAG